MQDNYKKRTWKIKCDVSTLMEIFLSQKKINVCENRGNMAPRAIIFIVCSRTFILFRYT